MKPLICTLLALVFCWSCSTGDETSTGNPEKNEAAQARLNELMDNLMPKAQQFTVSGKKPSKVKGKAGTEIRIRPENLVAEDGSAPGENIEVKLIELASKADMVRSGIATVSDGRLLESGGEYYIGMESDGKTLKLREGKYMDVKFPRVSDKKMELFYGEKDAEGNMNWVQADEQFNKEAPPADTQPLRDTTRSSDFEDLLAYMVADTADLIEMSKTHPSSRIYEAIQLKQLGWINCDRFLNRDNLTTITVTDSSVVFYRTFLIFDNINSIMSASTKPVTFERIPLGEKVTLISIKGDVNDLWVAKEKFSIQENMKVKLNFVPGDTSGLAELFDLEKPLKAN